MTRTVAGAEQWARLHVTDGGDAGFDNGYDWNDMCRSLMLRACDLSSSRGTAYNAWEASGEGHPDWSAAPRGAFHRWADAVRNTPGHVTLDLDGGGTRRLMATTHLSGGGAPGPGGTTQRVLQTLTQRGGCTGPVDGAVDVNGWQAVQTAVDVNGWQAVQTAVRG
ncbi:hypothetical protein R6L23_02075 [Streptomyces sp. SR27]|uniref:hypothetical protein n=1 Tax=Streptomyces sp. SR27 TaxID=3076630 RepID=UPI00295BBBA6|nr:hypothetical protein [Streptomyces sp. SR27]MDV9187018.1 hypothetical protein [Streptomyces sp. SR27]